MVAKEDTEQGKSDETSGCNGANANSQQRQGSCKRQRKTVQQFTYETIGESGSGITHTKKKRKRTTKVVPAKQRGGGAKRSEPTKLVTKTKVAKGVNATVDKRVVEKGSGKQKKAKVSTKKQEPTAKPSASKTPTASIEIVDNDDDCLTPRTEHTKIDPKCDPKKMLVASFFKVVRSPAITVTKTKALTKQEPKTVLVHPTTAKRLAELKVKVLREQRQQRRNAE
jgi:hypothetical protein